jgi:hypothetical protein
MCIIRIFTIKIEKFKLRGNNSVCAGEFQLLRGRSPAQLRGNIGLVLKWRRKRVSYFILSQEMILGRGNFGTCLGAVI